jgi:uncharacterized 2Fe-2S/4Fe-4S cluster protein (DUF4445 family)
VAKAEIIFQPMGRRTPLEEGDAPSLLDLARAAGVGIEATCGGKGTCAKCKVRLEGEVPPATEREGAALGAAVEEGWRLACQCRAGADASVWVPEESRPHKQVILTTGHSLDLELEPVVRAYDLAVPCPSLQNPRSDARRLIDSIPAAEPRDDSGGMSLALSALGKLPATLKEHSGRLTAAVRDFSFIMDITPGLGAACLGLAVDLGTTTLVAYLLDLGTGQVLSVAADMNPQVRFGDDVISRISHCASGPKALAQLSQMARGAVNQLAVRACRDAGVKPERIMECLMVGNTAMHHIFLGLDPAGLACAPFAPVLSEAWEAPAKQLGLKLAPEALLHWLPVKAGFVGADAVAVALAVEADRIEEATLILDLGTNGEMILAAGGRLFCCSTAAGPAFEGGHIRWGMRGAPGAVEKVRIRKDDLSPELQIIGSLPPAGICGSGLVSLTAGLLAAGAITPEGSFKKALDTPRLRPGRSGLEYLLAPAKDTALGRDLVFTAKDLSELQLAKAALQAGALLMMRAAGVERLERVILAGAFGNYLDPAEACALGMFPGVTASQVEGVGNAAGAGALMALASRRYRQKAGELAAGMRYLELSGHPQFQDCFVDSLTFSAPETKEWEKGLASCASS